MSGKYTSRRGNGDVESTVMEFKNGSAEAEIITNDIPSGDIAGSKFIQFGNASILGIALLVSGPLPEVSGKKVISLHAGFTQDSNGAILYFPLKDASDGAPIQFDVTNGEGVYALNNAIHGSFQYYKFVISSNATADVPFEVIYRGLK